jgi:diguanylate cyclase (GGDEF)-like protein
MTTTSSRTNGWLVPPQVAAPPAEHPSPLSAPLGSPFGSPLGEPSLALASPAVQSPAAPAHASTGPAHARAGLPGVDSFPTAVWLVVGATVVHVLLMLGTPGGSAVALWVSDLSSAVAAAVAGALCLRTAYAMTGNGRTGWTLLGLGALSWMGGELVWSTYELALGRQTPFPSLADVGYLAMVPLALAGMVLLIGPALTGIRTLLDGLVITGALLVVGWAVVLGPIYYRAEDDGLAKVLSLAYPAGDLALASMVVLLLARAADRRRAAFAIVATGLLGLSVSDGGFAYLTQVGSYASGGPVDSGWFAGFLLIGLGAAYALEQPPPAEPVARPWVALPYVPVSIAAVTMIVSIVAGTTDTFEVATAGAVVVLVMVRQVVMVRDDLSLTRRLEKTIKDLRDREEQLRYLAFHDALTGLANRALFMDRTEHALAGQPRDGSLLAVLYVDLDGFKEVNDELGHHSGDLILTAVAGRLRRCVRPADTLARLGGDEFAILVEQLSAPAEAELLATRIVETLAVPFGPAEGLDERPVSISGSVGAAVCAGGEKAGELLRRADHAMYSAKVSGRGRHVTLPPARLPLARVLPPQE